jgi:XTP/dITP diphosphohydrolase
VTPIVLATRNRGKHGEFAALLAGTGIALADLNDFPHVGIADEPHDSYLANASGKAILAAAATGMLALADDSGLEVDALHGAPGVRSARYAGIGASDADNVALLLAHLHDVAVPQRGARFRAVLVLAHPDGRTVAAEGECAGRITTARSGTGGFGYDPIFFYPPAGRTFAELSPAEKNRVSHRARACAALLPALTRPQGRFP